jgi:hypothetical protein
MVSDFLRLAAVSPTRQRAFRRAVAAHVIGLAIVVGIAPHITVMSATTLLGQYLLIAGIVEGALLIGWRLSQIPKSQALEFLLVTPLRPGRVFFAEAMVGLCRLALVTLAGLPVLVLLTYTRFVAPVDLLAFVVMPFTWGAITGLGLVAYAYEPITMRRWFERGMVLLILFYLGVGVLAGEKLRTWIDVLPAGPGQSFLFGFEAFHRYNPFSAMQFWTEQTWDVAWERMLGVELVALVLVVMLAARAASRLHGHFHERHYRPAVDQLAGRRQPVHNRPLAWWAVRRVTEYSGRINLWLAGGFGVLYALYIVAGSYWPAWMGHRVFQIFERVGGIPVLATALIVLAAVPAAYQYGLWDSNSQERCRRLELLLLTRLGAEDYWDAAAAAAWRRGRGYFMVALLLWLACVIAGKMTWSQALATVAAGVLLWGLYFTVGFRAFARGMQANSMGLLLTLGLPALTLLLYYASSPVLAALVPPGAIYSAGSAPVSFSWIVGPVLCGVATLVLARFAQARCDAELRRWYDQHHGSKVMD